MNIYYKERLVSSNERRPDQVDLRQFEFTDIKTGLLIDVMQFSLDEVHAMSTAIDHFHKMHPNLQVSGELVEG